MSSIAPEIRRRGATDVSDDAAVLAAFSSDASLYRVPPAAVVFPRDADEVRATLAAARELGLPVTARGAGTSVAGNAIGTGIVIDFSRHMNKVLEVDRQTATAVVQPGVVQAVLQAAASPYGLQFGPDPSTSTRCTIGGMIGTDACGARSLAFGRTSHNTLELRGLLADGSDLVTTQDSWAAPGDVLARVRKVIAGDLATARTEFGTFGRHVSGLAVEHLLPERFNPTRALVGSEGTLAVLTEATVRLVGTAAATVLVVLGFADFPSAGHATPEVLAFEPSACEGLDRRITDVIRKRGGPAAIRDLPPGDAWLFVELSGDNLGEVRRKADRLANANLGVSALVIEDPDTADRLWQIRADGAGLAGRGPSGRPAWAGWEDAAVPPDRLGTYLNSFDNLLATHGLTAMPFGHFGEGCVHVRMDFAFDAADGAARYRSFVEAAADLVASHGGSLSGEHGDGRARSELLPRMYSSRALALMAGVKKAFDPDGLLNPGIIVDAASLTADLRYPSAARLAKGLALAYASDGGDFRQAVHRCTGVGKCRADNTGSGGVMCPSFQATRDEIHSTRGRSRLLQEIVSGDSDITWDSPAVHEALDLCLSCKGCASDCPTGTDMASYKAEVLHQTYRGRVRPRTHYSVGWLPRWAKVGSLAPGVANRTMAIDPLRKMALRVAGVDTRRRLPDFASRTFRRTFDATAAATPTAGRPVVLFVDSFTNHFTPSVADASVAVLREAGFAPRITRQQECCGLPWISTGQLDSAARRLRAMVDALATDVRAGVPVVGIEPSCTAVLRHELTELVDGEDALLVANATHTLAELLATAPEWQPRDLAGVSVVAQPHCHHHAVMGWETDKALLERAGATVNVVPGCCGMAGNFGVEKGHYELSLAIAEQHLLPAVRRQEHAGRRVVLADGFSCRTQLHELIHDALPLHLAELLAGRRI